MQIQRGKRRCDSTKIIWDVSSTRAKKEKYTMNDQKIVHFGEYCPKCEHYPKSESEDPCWECLDTPMNSWSHKPVYFKEKEKNNA